MEPPPPKFPPDWEAEYKHELRLARRTRMWATWLQKHKPTVRARLEELNPNGCVDGAVPRGWHKKYSGRDIWSLDLVSVGAYQKKWGFAATKIFKHNGRKKYVSRQDYQRGTAHNPPCIAR